MAAMYWPSVIVTRPGLGNALAGIPRTAVVDLDFGNVPEEQHGVRDHPRQVSRENPGIFIGQGNNVQPFA
jgi:hypothetical protein